MPGGNGLCPLGDRPLSNGGPAFRHRWNRPSVAIGGTGLWWLLGDRPLAGLSAPPNAGNVERRTEPAMVVAGKPAPHFRATFE